MEVLLERLEWRGSQIVGGLGTGRSGVRMESACDEGVGRYAGAAHCVAGVRGVSVVVVSVCDEGVGWYTGVAHCIVAVRSVSVCCCSGWYQKFVTVCLYQTCYSWVGAGPCLSACLYRLYFRFLLTLQHT